MAYVMYVTTGFNLALSSRIRLDLTIALYPADFAVR